MTTNGNGVNWRPAEGNGTKPEDPLWFLKNTGKTITEDYQAAIDLALAKTQAMREAEAKFGSPGTAGIEVRHDQGLLHRENPEDRKRADALKKNRDREILTARHINDLGGYIAKGEEYVMDVGKHLNRVTADLPVELQELGTTLTIAGMKILSASFIEGAKMNAEMGMQEISQATKPEADKQ
jgi:hypothetical protein